MQAMLDGYADAVALDESGLLSEGSGQNLFLVRDNVIYTPVARLVGAAGHHPRHRHDAGQGPRASRCARPPIPREFLYLADEAFFCGTAVEITPIRSFDKIAVGNGKRGPVTEALQQRFFAILRGDHPDTHGWLTPVGPAVGSR